MRQQRLVDELAVDNHLAELLGHLLVHSALDSLFDEHYDFGDHHLEALGYLAVNELIEILNIFFKVDL